MYILGTIRTTLLLLQAKQKLSLISLQIFFLVSAIIQIGGIASIAPFIAILSNPEFIHKNEILSFFYDRIGFENNQQFIVAFALASLVMICISNGISALTQWLLLKYSISVGRSIQSGLFNNLLRREYIFHKTTNYTKSIATISQEAPRFVYMVLQPFLVLTSQLLVALIILVGLLVLNPVIAFASAALVGGSYLITYFLVKKSLVRHGHILTDRNQRIQAILSESFIGAKDIKLNSLEKKYIDAFDSVNHRGLNSIAYMTLSGDLPKFVIETISFGAILLLATVLLLTENNIEGVVSTLSIYALAGYKLLPTMQQVYKSISSISANGSVVDELRYELNTPVSEDRRTLAKPLPDIKHLVLRNLSYSYPKSNQIAIDNVSATFERGQLNTIAGPSGSGKSTLGDMILGLLPPSGGSIIVNDAELSEEILPNYQRSIGYVPQNIFILDDTVVANVAFGVPKNEIDLEKVNKALWQANALEFVNRLPQGITTQLGQDGKLLSGGQKQRIGIARTLYRDNRILLLDEPTSALDIHSEHELMMLLNTLKEQMLIIVISHRPLAIKLSGNIVLMEKGRIAAAGSYEELGHNSKNFQEMMRKF